MRIALLTFGLCLAAPVAASAQSLSGGELELAVDAELVPEPRPAAEAGGTYDVEALEAALRIPMESFDGLRFIEIARSATTAVLETYCAIGMLIPDASGVQGGDIALGLGCLAGAATLLVFTGLRIADAADDSEEWERLRRFRAAADEGLDEDELDAFAAELAEDAHGSRVRRGLAIGMGIALLAATGILIGFTASGDIDGTPGTTIAAGTGVVGLMSLSTIFMDSPAEAAERAFAAAR